MKSVGSLGFRLFCFFMEDNCPQTIWTEEATIQTSWGFDGCLAGAPGTTPVIPPIIQPPNNPEATMDDAIFLMDDALAIMDS